MSTPHLVALPGAWLSLEEPLVATLKYRAFFAARVDGLFSDNADTARLARHEFVTGLVAFPAA